MLMEPPASQGASSSRSASPAIPPSSRTTSAGSLPPNAVSPVVAAAGKGSGRDLPHPPHPSVDHLSASSNPTSLPPSPAVYQQQHSHSHSQQQALPPSPLPQQQLHQPQIPSQGVPAQPYHAHHASNQSIGGAGHATLNLPPAAPHGPRQPPGPAGVTRSRTPSPDRNGNFTPSHTPPTTAQGQAHVAPNLDNYGPPPHPPPHLRAAAGAGTTGIAGPPPGLARVDIDAARRYSSDEDDLMTPIRPSAKAMGKRKAPAEETPDEEELGLSIYFVYIRLLLIERCYREKRGS